jgi:hypothetical protein
MITFGSEESQSLMEVFALTKLRGILIMLVFSGILAAQDDSSMWVSGGFGFGRNTEQHLNNVGFQVEFADYLTKNFGVLVGFSGAYGNFQSTIDLSSHGVYFGPQLRFPTRSRITPFVRVVGGIGRATNSILERSISATTNTVSLGGGIEIELSRHLALRPFSFDYSFVWYERQRTSGFGLGPGITFKF